MNAKKMILFSCSWIVTTVAVAQGQFAALLSTLKKADSVVLVSHEHFRARRSYGYQEKELIAPERSSELILEGKLNRDIVREYQRINGRAVDSLAGILSLPEGKYRQYAACFNPHHAILICRDKAITYLDICFKCKNYITSEMTGREDALDPRMLKRLKQFFKDRGFVYELDQ